MPEISLIPPQQKERALPRLATFRGPKTAFLASAKVSLLVLAVVVLASIVLYGWSLQLKRSFERTNQELAAVAKERDAALEKNLGELSTFLKSFKGLVENHRVWSRLFKIIEERTVARLTFTAFEGSYETGEFLLKGLAPNYKTIANQVKSFEAEEGIKWVELANLSLNTEGEVTFTMRILFEKEIIKYE